MKWSFDDIERRRLFHLAYEHRYRTQLLNAISKSFFIAIEDTCPTDISSDYLHR